MLVAQCLCIASGGGHFKVTNVPGNQHRYWLVLFFSLKYVDIPSHHICKRCRYLIETLYFILHYSESTSCLCFCLVSPASFCDQGEFRLEHFEVGRGGGWAVGRSSEMFGSVIFKLLKSWLSLYNAESLWAIQGTWVERDVCFVLFTQFLGSYSD